MKIVEHSRDLKCWHSIFKWSDEEATEKWEKLQSLIHKTQIHGFFRMVDGDKYKEAKIITNEKL